MVSVVQQKSEMAVAFPRERPTWLNLQLTFSQRYRETYRKVTQESASKKNKTNRFPFQAQ